VLSMSVLVVRRVSQVVYDLCCQVTNVRGVLRRGSLVIWRYCGVLQSDSHGTNIYCNKSKSYSTDKNAMIGCASVMRIGPL
jgi:hypothetical protein